jgi:CheY-like chemotaxis protein
MSKIMHHITNKNKMSQKVEPARARSPSRSNSCCRILVVDQNSDLRLLYGDALTRPDCRVDVVADGEAAWAALQAHRYDLLITENETPSLTGEGLINKLLSARVEVPVVIVAEGLHTQEAARNPSHPCAAMLLKPFALNSLMDTVKGVLRAAVPVVVSPASPPAAIHELEAKQARELLLQSPDNAGRPIAVALSVRGKCVCCEDGARFAKLESGHILRQGAIIRTGQNARTDLLFRRTKTTVRLQAGSEIRLEKMAVTFKDGLPVVHTLLHLHAGKIFTVVQDAVAGGTLEIRNGTGRSMADGNGVSSCIIAADETLVWAQGSAIPIKVRGENGSTIVAASEHLAGKNGARLPASANLKVKELVELRELQVVAETFAAEKQSSIP